MRVMGFDVKDLFVNLYDLVGGIPGVITPIKVVMLTTKIWSLKKLP